MTRHSFHDTLEKAIIVVTPPNNINHTMDELNMQAGNNPESVNQENIGVTDEPATTEVTPAEAVESAPVEETSAPEEPTAPAQQ